MLGGVLIAFDASKTHDIDEFKKIISDVLNREQTFEEVRTITFLGALDRVLHPSKLFYVPFPIEGDVRHGRTQKKKNLGRGFIEPVFLYMNR